MQNLEETITDTLAKLDSTNWDEGGARVVLRELLLSERENIIKSAKEKLPEKKNKPHTEPIPELKGWHLGYNQCLSEVKQILTELINPEKSGKIGL